MERFRLRVRNEPKRGDIWELHLFPDQPHRILREADARTLGSASSPEAILWLRKLAKPYLEHAHDQTGNSASIDSEEFGPRSEPRWLDHEDGMRLALAFSSARWLVTGRQRTMFRDGLYALPSEVVLYWFTLCFYGYRQAAGRAALRVLLAYDETADEASPTSRRKKGAKPDSPSGSLFASDSAGGQSNNKE